MASVKDPETEGHAEACEITIGFELEPSCTCGLEERREAWAEIARLRERHDAAMSALSEHGQLKREEIQLGLAYCVRLVIEKWSGASAEAEQLRKLCSDAFDAARMCPDFSPDVLRRLGLEPSA